MSDIFAWVFWSLLVVAGIALSAMYAAAEIALYVTNKIRLELQAEMGSQPARLLQKLLSDTNNLLAVLMTGNNLVNYVTTFALTSLFTMAGQGQHAETYTMVTASTLLFILGESVPKNVGQRVGDAVAYRLAKPLWISNLIYRYTGIAPLIGLVGVGITRIFRADRRDRSPLGHEGFAAIMAEGQASGALTHFQSIMADRIMHISSVRLMDVMIPMERVICIPRGATHEQLQAIARQHEFSRFPVIDADGRIAGILDIYDYLVAPQQDPTLKLPSPLKLPFFMTVTDGLYHMQSAAARMAIITDDRAKPIGIVTIKDLVEEIVGELEAW